MNKKLKITIYGKKDCLFTQKAKEYFEENKIQFNFSNINDSSIKEEMINISSQSTIPVIKINDNVFIGLQTKEISNLIG